MNSTKLMLKAFSFNAFCSLGTGACSKAKDPESETLEPEACVEVQERQPYLRWLRLPLIGSSLLRDFC